MEAVFSPIYFLKYVHHTGFRRIHGLSPALNWYRNCYNLVVSKSVPCLAKIMRSFGSQPTEVQLNDEQSLHPRGIGVPAQHRDVTPQTSHITSRLSLKHSKGSYSPATMLIKESGPHFITTTVHNKGNSNIKSSFNFSESM